MKRSFDRNSYDFEAKRINLLVNSEKDFSLKNNFK